ncbi:MAG: hypothetical protein AAGC47_09625, partial [Bacteroidota bacterium]
MQKRKQSGRIAFFYYSTIKLTYQPALYAVGQYNHVIQKRFLLAQIFFRNKNLDAEMRAKKRAIRLNCS